LDQPIQPKIENQEAIWKSILFKLRSKIKSRIIFGLIFRPLSSSDYNVIFVEKIFIFFGFSNLERAVLFIHGKSRVLSVNIDIYIKKKIFQSSIDFWARIKKKLQKKYKKLSLTSTNIYFPRKTTVKFFNIFFLCQKKKSENKLFFCKKYAFWKKNHTALNKICEKRQKKICGILYFLKILEKKYEFGIARIVRAKLPRRTWRERDF